MMNSRHVSVFLLLLVAATPVYAIPPPDMIASVWQSLLQMFGVAAVFLTGAVFALRQWLEHYLGKWQRPVLYSLLALTVGLVGWLLIASSPVWATNTSPDPGAIQVERLPVEAIIRREQDAWVRDWKLQTAGEMKREANLARQRKHLPAVQYQVVDSLSPEKLHRVLTARPQDVYLLDIREASERSHFRINHQAVFRYGDLAQDIMPPHLPANKLIVVLCHSGLRGYFGAYFLNRAGFKNVAFLQGGLAQWDVENYPVVGEAEYKLKHRPLLNKAQARAPNRLKIQVDPDGIQAVRLPGLIRLPYETASSADLEPVLQAARRQPAVVVCKTYGGCFHALNLAWLIEQRGGRVVGIYDDSGEYVEQFFR